MGCCSLLIGLLLRNKQHNHYGLCCPEPGTPEASVAVLCGPWHLAHEPLAPGVPCPSPVSVATGALSALGYFHTPGESEGVVATIPGPWPLPLPTRLPFGLLLDWLAVAFSACTAGSVAETQTEGFKLPGARFSQRGHLQGSRDTCWPAGFR